MSVPAKRITGTIPLILASVALVGACSSVGTVPTATAPASAPTITPTPTLASPSSVATPTQPAPDGDHPPDAHLSDGTVTVAGELRTYCWIDTCADAFELPPMTDLPLQTLADASTELDFSLAGAQEFISWHASYGAASMADLMPLDEGGEDYDPDMAATVPPLLSRATLPAPPSGDWILYVVVRAVEGEAHYAWHVTVP